MLYAILQEVERKWPDADVFIARSRVPQGLAYIKTKLRLHNFPFERIIEKMYINEVLYKLGIPSIECMNFIKADYFFDGSGFLFSDQTKLWGTTPQWWERKLKFQKSNGAKVVFLPQAFGPFDLDYVKQTASVLSQYSDIIMAREQVSYEYLKQTGIVNMNKVKIFPDFTSLVDGVFPEQYKRLRNGICIIPNIRMIKNGKISYEDYIQLLKSFVQEGEKSGHPVYLLNHEGTGDAKLCYKCKDSLKKNIEVVTNLNALEVKGLIASAYLVVTSRFHGLASSLNCHVPSLATSWSHKYEELYKDYGLDNYVLPLDNLDAAVYSVRVLLDENNNKRIREQLEGAVLKIKAQTMKMWEEVWNA